MPGEHARSPVIVLGMHRSGTSMISRALEQFGLFVGWKKEVNHEAVFFLRLNDWLLHLAGGAWDNPERIGYLIENQEARTLVCAYIRRLLNSPKVANYMGFRKYLRYRSPLKWDLPWGWKDPRNTFTLPIWLEIFPNARVIHIFRNGVDVAHSLRKRSLAELEQFSHWMKRLRWRHKYVKRPFPKIVGSLSCFSLDEGFRLWESYTRTADSHLEAIGKARTISIRYEDFVEDPEPHLAQLGRFCDLNPDAETIRSVTKSIDPSRSKVYQRDEELLKFYQSVQQTPQMLRYSY